MSKSQKLLKGEEPSLKGFLTWQHRRRNSQRRGVAVCLGSPTRFLLQFLDVVVVPKLVPLPLELVKSSSAAIAQSSCGNICATFDFLRRRRLHTHGTPVIIAALFHLRQYLEVLLTH